MGSSEHRRANNALREHLNDLVQQLEPGESVLTKAVCLTLTKRRRSLDTRQVANLLRERSDLQYVGWGEFRKV